MEEKSPTFVSAVIYVHDDATNLPDFAERVRSELSAHFLNYEMIFVDDSSTDDSREVIKNLAREGAELRLVRMSYYQGVELSMDAGDDLAIGDFVYEFDQVRTDFGAELIYEVYSKALEGYDIVSAAPREAGRISSRIFYSLFNRFSGAPVKLRTEAFRVLSRRAINRVRQMSRTVPYRKALYSNAGLAMDTIVFDACEKTDRRGTQENAIRRELAADSFILFTDLGYRFALCLAGLMMFTTIAAATYALSYYFWGKPVAGWTSAMVFLSLGFFCVFALFAIIIKYLSVLVNLVFKKRRYAIEDVDKLPR